MASWWQSQNREKGKKRGIKSINSKREEDYKGLMSRVPSKAHTTKCPSAGNAPKLGRTTGVGIWPSKVQAVHVLSYRVPWFLSLNPWVTLDVEAIVIWCQTCYPVLLCTIVTTVIFVLVQPVQRSQEGVISADQYNFTAEEICDKWSKHINGREERDVWNLSWAPQIRLTEDLSATVSDRTPESHHCPKRQKKVSSYSQVWQEGKTQHNIIMWE